MFLNIGGEVKIQKKNIIAILNMKTSAILDETKNYLKILKEDGNIVNISKKIGRSVVITEKNNKKIVYISPVSSITLLQRVNKKRYGYVKTE